MPMPLDGIKVIDWTIWQQGPVASTMLGDLGADIIGGCCRIGPAHVRELRSVVDERGVSPAR